MMDDGDQNSRDKFMCPCNARLPVQCTVFGAEVLHFLSVRITCRHIVFIAMITSADA